MNDLYHGFVYLWENTHPEAKKYKKYIGQHVGTIDDGYIGSGKIFSDSFFSNKYHGHWKRSILEFCNTQEELNQAELDIYNYMMHSMMTNTAISGKEAVAVKCIPNLAGK